LNIAIFGGSFDPPHIAHENIVNEVIENINIDKLFVVPTYLSPFKDKYHLEPKERFELLTTLFEDDKKVEVTNFEIIQNRAVPTIETVEYLNKKYNPKNIYLIIGADNLQSIHLWNNFEQLHELVKFVVISREGYEVKNDIIRFNTISMDIDISSTYLRDNFNLKYIPKKIQQKVKNIWKKD
jgi:nicotinate-nucleotide adenylyltransferase